MNFNISVRQEIAPTKVSNEGYRLSSPLERVRVRSYTSRQEESLGTVTLLFVLDLPQLRSDAGRTVYSRLTACPIVRDTALVRFIRIIARRRGPCRLFSRDRLAGKMLLSAWTCNLFWQHSRQTGPSPTCAICCPSSPGRPSPCRWELCEAASCPRSGRGSRARTRVLRMA